MFKIEIAILFLISTLTPQHTSVPFLSSWGFTNSSREPHYVFVLLRSEHSERGEGWIWNLLWVEFHPAGLQLGLHGTFSLRQELLPEPSAPSVAFPNWTRPSVPAPGQGWADTGSCTQVPGETWPHRRSQKGDLSLAAWCLLLLPLQSVPSRGFTSFWDFSHCSTLQRFPGS